MFALSPIFCDNAIVQACKPLRIFGTSNSDVTLTLGKYSVTAKPSNGRFTATFAPHRYGDVCELTVTDGDTTHTVHSLTFGDVYLFAGQSNMEYKLRESTPDGSVLSTPDIRLYSTDKYLHNDPYSPADGWVSLDEQSAPNFSAIAYFTARDLYRRTPRPIGIISAHQGASVIETWMSEQAHAELDIHQKPEDLSGDHFFPRYAQWNQNALLYNMDILPILPYSLAGAIFYQGESNFGEGESYVYERYLSKLVESWRREFEDAELPFVIVQIADYINRDTPAWHRIQQAQANVCDALPRCHLAICRDVCETDNIHPPTKHRLAARIAAHLDLYTGDNTMNRQIGNLFILGDSYSTFEGHIPEGFGPYYTTVPQNDTDVTRVEQTWWHIFVQKTGASLVRNCSWSGTTICNTGYDGCDNSKRSFIARLDRLIADGFFESNKIDTLLVFGGTNDAWSNAPLGVDVREGWTKEDLYTVRPAVFYLANRLKMALPDVRCVFILNCEIKDAVIEVLKTACAEYGFETVVLHDIDKTSGHPTIRGMAQIAEQVSVIAE